MKKFVILCGWLFAINMLVAQPASNPKASDLIPKPLNCIDKQGVFRLSSVQKIYAPTEFTEVAMLLAEQLNLGNPVVKQNNGASIVFFKADEGENLGAEGYKLNISPDKISIYAFTRQVYTHSVATVTSRYNSNSLCRNYRLPEIQL